MDIQKIVVISLFTGALAFTTTAFSLDQPNQPNETNRTTLSASDTGVHIPTPEEDQTIAQGIKNEIAKRQTLSRFNIGVTSDKGIVTLTGNVDSNSQASSLIQLAQSVIGVRDVDSRLTVQRSRQVLTDTVITAKVRGLFLRETVLGRAAPGQPGIDTMNVETRNGIVFLTGTVQENRDVDRAIALIKGLRGVKGVEYKFRKPIAKPVE